MQMDTPRKKRCETIVFDIYKILEKTGSSLPQDNFEVWMSLFSFFRLNLFVKNLEIHCGSCSPGFTEHLSSGPGFNSVRVTNSKPVRVTNSKLVRVTNLNFLLQLLYQINHLNSSDSCIKTLVARFCAGAFDSLLNGVRSQNAKDHRNPRIQGHVSDAFCDFA